MGAWDGSGWSVFTVTDGAPEIVAGTGPVKELIVAQACLSGFSGQSPLLVKSIVIRLGQQDVERIPAGIDSGDEGAELGFGHGCAARGGPGSVLPPDMEENGRARSWNRLRQGIMGNEELQGVRVILLPHLGSYFPFFPGFVFENEVMVIMRRGRILDPEVTGGNLAVG
jgi:hypothetical protein